MKYKRLMENKPSLMKDILHPQSPGLPITVQKGSDYNNPMCLKTPSEIKAHARW